MINEICWLVTLLYDDWLVQCALKVPRDSVSLDCATYPMEPDNRKRIHALLPDHIRSVGPIVNVQEIFDIHEVGAERQTNTALAD